jgi:hypothetical protein
MTTVGVTAGNPWMQIMCRLHSNYGTITTPQIPLCATYLEFVLPLQHKATQLSIVYNACILHTVPCEHSWSCPDIHLEHAFHLVP